MYRKTFNDADEMETIGSSIVSELEVIAHQEAAPRRFVIIRAYDRDADEIAQLDISPAKARKVARAILKAADKAEGGKRGANQNPPTGDRYAGPGLEGI